jgi:hypothetical protein
LARREPRRTEEWWEEQTKHTIHVKALYGKMTMQEQIATTFKGYGPIMEIQLGGNALYVPLLSHFPTPPPYLHLCSEWFVEFRIIQSAEHCLSSKTATSAQDHSAQDF